MLHPVFQELANRQETSGGGPSRAIHRRVAELINKIKPLLSNMRQELESVLDENKEPLIDALAERAAILK